MSRPVPLLSLLCFLAAAFWLGSASGDETIVVPAGTHCVGCGMTCRPDSPFTAAIRGRTGELSFFCDIGELMAALKNHQALTGTVLVRDYPTKSWIAGDRAFFVKSKSFHSPMMWDIAAFAIRDQASRNGAVLDLAHLTKTMP